MSERRFEHVNIPDPGAVTALSREHPAVRDRRPMFPGLVVSAKDAPRIFIEGKNNRKIGNTVEVGALKGMPIYTLTLPERTTCPASCHIGASCYGNAMHWARRHAPGPELEARIKVDIAALAAQHSKGFLVRLHVLGDFYSVEYIKIWSDLLIKHPGLHVYGYTANLPDAIDVSERAIGLALKLVKATFGDRFAVRWSAAKSRADGATVIDRIPETSTVAEGLVCPAETQDAACCASCGLCWAPAARGKTIVFIRHGRGSRQSDAVAREYNTGSTDEGGQRQIKPLPPMGWKPNQITSQPPEILWINPRELWVEPQYQRGLSSRSMRLIRRIVENWSWAKVKPPIVTRVGLRLEVIDGQHTALAAATHPMIDKIPVLLVATSEARERADAFIGHNRDRVIVTSTQLHHSAVAAGDTRALLIERVCRTAGAKILKAPPAYGAFVTGETLAVSAVGGLIGRGGAEQAARVLAILVEAKQAPLGAAQMRAVSHLLQRPSFAAGDSDRQLVRAIRSMPAKAATAEAMALSARKGLPRWQALAEVYGGLYARRVPAEAA